MGDWSYLSALLDKVQSHSTVVGKIWMSVLFLFRIFVLGAAADKVWGDEVSEFYCDSHEPGCAHACYNWMFPISYIHYWVLQIIFVSTPTLVYLGYAVHIIHKEKKMMVHMQSNTNCKKTGGWMKPKYTDDRGKVKIKGILFGTYLTQLVFKILLEVAFAVGQIYIYGSIFIDSYFHCSKSPPCARMSGAQCYISRPTEKSIFILFMLVVSGISVLLNIIEIIYLICHNRKSSKKQFVAQPHQFSSEQLQMQPSRGSMREEYKGSVLSPLPSQGHEGDCTDDPHFDLASKEKEN